MIAQVKSKKFVIIVIIVITVLTIPISIMWHQTAFAAPRSCPVQISDASIADYGGFLFNTVFNKGGNGKIPGLNEFLLTPGSTGYLTMTYDFTSNNSTRNVFENLYHTTPSKFFSNYSDQIWKSTEFNHSLDLVSAKTLGMHIYVSKVTNVNDHVLQVTYTIVADASAERGTYLISIYQSCPGELLTVGYWPYLG